MVAVCLASIFVLFLTLLAFFLGRGYEFFANNKRSYSENWLRYQSGLLWGCRKENQENGRTQDSFFVHNGYKRIVIYAVGGVHYNSLIASINKEQFDEIYLADANNLQLSKQFGERVYAKEELPELIFDVIVVTSVAHFSEIASELRQLGISKDIVSYSDLVFNAAKED